MKKPCINCPFRTDCPPGWLGKKRATAVAQSALSDVTFHCHKTVDYSEEPAGDITTNSTPCAGSVLLHVKEGRPNAYYRFIDSGYTGAERVFNSVKEMVKHHT